ncbi:MAG: NfeD family protein [Planctomycetota bacterium]
MSLLSTTRRRTRAGAVSCLSHRCFLVGLAYAFVVGLSGSANAEAKRGYYIDVPVPLTTQSSTRLLDQLDELAESISGEDRTTVVMRYSADSAAGEATAFEDALKVARAMTGERFRELRFASLIETEVRGHSVLPVLASDVLLLSPNGMLADASAGDPSADETILLSYQSIASRRGLFPDPLVEALVDPSVELVNVSLVGGGKRFASGENLVKLRETGEILEESSWSAAGVAGRFTAEQLRSARIAARIVETVENAAEVLDLSEVVPVNSSGISGEAKGVLLEINGSISRSRVRRWQSNLNASLDDEDVNTWLISINSIGGDIDQSATLASAFAIPDPPLRTAAGFVSEQARGDSLFLALACKPLWLHPDARLGGLGADAITLQDLDNHAELIESISRETRRPIGLIRGLLCSELEIYKFTNKTTGQIKFATEDELLEGAEDVELERDRWERGDRLELAEGIDAAQAIQFGLAEGTGESIEELARSVGLPGVPEPVSDRGLVRFVEKLGRSQGLMMFVLMVGFIGLSAEMNAPGLGAPGFLALVCFGLFFWMNYLAGTAEWLELILLVLGLGCICLELFVIPGFGIFGIGGLLMTIASIVLMSQTFVLPQNSYQLTVITRGIWGALISLLGLFGGFFVMRKFFPHLPLFRHLIMETPDAVAIDQAEKLADFTALLNQQGTATTPLRPSGKARFGDEVIQVVSDGSMIEKGATVTVVDVQGSRVVVEG